MEIFKGGELDYKEGKVVLAVEIAALVVPSIESIKAQIESGAIDPVKGTDIDKTVMLQSIDLLLDLLKK